MPPTDAFRGAGGDGRRRRALPYAHRGPGEQRLAVPRARPLSQDTQGQGTRRQKRAAAR